MISTGIKAAMWHRSRRACRRWRCKYPGTTMTLLANLLVIRAGPLRRAGPGVAALPAGRLHDQQADA
ncbi:MAG: hypothetical protein ACLUNO_09635 [Oscillospiraceae bacterium]